MHLIRHNAKLQNVSQNCNRTEKQWIVYLKTKVKIMKNKILFVVSLLFGMMFINAGLNKFFNYMPMPKDMPESMNRVMAAFMQIK